VIENIPPGELLLSFLLKNTAYSLVLFIIVAVAVRFLPRRFALLRYLMWSLIFIRLVLPPNFALPISSGALLGAGVPSLGALESGPVTHDGLGDVPLGDRESTVLNRGIFGEVGTGTHVLLLVWIVGVLLSASILTINRRRFLRIARRGTVVDDPDIDTALNRWLGNFSIRRAVTVLTTEAQTPAYTVGTFRPVIVIPSWILALKESRADRPAVLESIIAHETAHIARFDDLALQVQGVLSALYFFNPFVWIAGSRMRLENDVICDSAVLSRATIVPREYGRALLAAVEGCGGSMLVSHFARTASQLKARIRTIMSSSQKTPRTFSSIFVALGFGVILLPMASHSDAAEPELSATTEIHEPDFQHPLPEARLSSGFGMRRHPIDRDMRMHSGIDLAIERGKPVKAAASGVVSFADMRGAWGNLVIIDHGDGYETYYAQLDSMTVSVNDRVPAGGLVGTVGASGAATAPHLHFEIHVNGDPANPVDFGIGAR